MTPYDNFQMQLVDIRVQSGITQTELAKRANISLNTVNRIEVGEVKPSIGTVLRIADATKTSLDYLFGLTQAKDDVVPELSTKREVGNKIKNIRVKSGLKQYQFANILNIKRRQLISIEKGTSRLALNAAFKLNSHYGISLDDIYRKPKKIA